MRASRHRRRDGLALSGLYLARLADVIVSESQARAQVLASTILHRVSTLTIDPADKYAALRDDAGLRSILEATVYDKAVTGAAIVDSAGTIVMHREPGVGRRLRSSAGDLSQLWRQPVRSSDCG